MSHEIAKKIFFAIFFSNFSTRICSLYRWNWPMIWVSFESSRPDLVRKRVKSLKSRLFKKKFLDSAKLFASKQIYQFCWHVFSILGYFMGHESLCTMVEGRFKMFQPFKNFHDARKTRNRCRGSLCPSRLERLSGFQWLIHYR